MPQRAPEITGPRFRGKVVGNWTNSGPKGQAWIRPDGVAESERKDVLLYRQHVASGLQLKAGDRVEYGHAAQKTTQGRTVARNVTKVDAGALRRAPVRNAGAKVEDAGVPLAQRVTRPRDDGLQRALAASRADFDAEEQKRLAEREEKSWRKRMLSAAAASEDDRRRREQGRPRLLEEWPRWPRPRKRRRRPRSARPTPRRRRVAEVVVAGTETQPEQRPPDNLAEAGAARRRRAQLAEIERARRAAAEELRASQNIVEDARRRAARTSNGRRRRPPRPPSCPRTGVATEDAGHAKHGAQGIQLGTSPPSTASSATLSFLASIGARRRRRQEQIDCMRT